MATKLRTSLAGGLDVAGTIEQVDVLSCIGKVAFEVIIETSDEAGEGQAESYAVLCDLLATRMRQGADQVLGCLVFKTAPEPGSLATALDGMIRIDGNEIFTPVLALSAVQAKAMAEGGMTLEPLVDSAADLIRKAADGRPATIDTAETLLAELDELISRRIPQ